MTDQTQSPPSGTPRQAPEEGTPMPRQYRPEDHERRIRRRWDQARAFHADPGRVHAGEAEPYCVLIPPPNVTAALHLGHAVNNTLQDILVRAHRMRGFETLWMPGTDHAGIATQSVVERRLMETEGRRKADFTREDFVEKVHAHSTEFEGRITDQLKQLGCSCDYERQRFTMDDVCGRAVREAFFRLFKDGLIYRGKRLVNWDPVLQTAVADDEVESVEIDGIFAYLRYPLVHPPANPDDPMDAQEVTWSELAARGYPGAETMPEDDNAWVTVATTRPETYLGDTAVAMNPDDPRLVALDGLMVQLPIVGRVIPIITDSYVVMPDPEADDAKARMATGFLKVTPAHDPNDWEIGVRHGLEVINVLAPDASISDEHGWARQARGEGGHVFVGRSREEARDLVRREFEARNLLEKVVPHRHAVGHSDRSKVPIEPYLSDQWYVKVTDDRLRGNAQRALSPDQRTRESLEAWPASRPHSSSASTPSRGTGVPPVATDPTASKDPAESDTAVRDALQTHQRNLPHWQRGSSTYFLTFRLAAGELSEDERRIALEACFHWHEDRAVVRLASVMPDHVHLILTPLRKSDEGWWPVQDLVHSIKSYSAHEILKARGTSGPLWQDEYYDRLIRDETEYEETFRYVQQNPVAAGLAEQPADYPFTRRGDSATREEGSSHGRDARATRSGSPERPATRDEFGDGTMRFHPGRYARTYETWHDHLRDWCISRQLWWGHRIPVWRIEPKIQHIAAFHEPSAYAEDLQRLIEELARSEDVISQFCVRAENETTVFLLASTEPGQELLERLQQLVRTGGTLHQPGDPIQHEQAGNRPDLFKHSGVYAVKAGLAIHDMDQDPDVLDTWFSSALWPLSTMGWPDPHAAARDTGIDDFPQLLDAFNPTSVLSTARDIITLWVSRMVMFNRHFRPDSGGAPADGPSGESAAPGAPAGPVPFRDVFVHAMIQDGEGRKMSKSLGNGIDPLEIIESHGADALRFTLCHMTTQTQDVRLPVQTDPETGKNTSPKFDLGRNFCNKLWNASRFALGILESAKPVAFEPDRLALADRWMLSRLRSAVIEANSALERYEFSHYAVTLYDLLWRDFCDWYLEGVKPTARDNPAQQAVLRNTLDAILRLLHPVCPFITEAIHERLAHVQTADVSGLDLGSPDESGLLCRAPWPSAGDELADYQAERAFERVQSLVSAIREVRAQHNVPPKRQITLHLPEELERELAREGALDLVATLAGVEAFKRPEPDPGESGLVEFTFETTTLAAGNLADAVDQAAERERLEKLIDELRGSIGALEKRLDNPGYVQKAPAHLVQQTRDELASKRGELDAALEALERVR